MKRVISLLVAICIGIALLVGVPTHSSAQPSAVYHVCIRPPELPAGVTQWSYTTGATLVTGDAMAFWTKTAGQPLYVFSPGAPLNSVKRFPKQHAHLRCPARVIETSSVLPNINDVPPESLPRPALGMCENTLPAPSALPTVVLVPGQKTPMTGPRVDDKPGEKPASDGEPGSDGKRASERKPATEGTPLPESTPIEKVAEELVYAAAIAAGQMNEETVKDGHRFGILGGKNFGGSSDPYKQIAAAVGIILVQALPSPVKIKQALVKALERGERILWTTTNPAMEKAAELLAKTFGKKRLAAALEQVGMIAPYRLMRKFTEGLNGLYHAHHLLEVARMKDWFPTLNPDLTPSVILSWVEHQKLHNKLATLTPTAKSSSELWALYQEAYKKFPRWLEAIEPYFK